MDALCAIQGDRLVVVLGGVGRRRQGRPTPSSRLLRRRARWSSARCADDLAAAHVSARAALSGLPRGRGLAGRPAPGAQRRPAARAGAGRRRPRPPAPGRRGLPAAASRGPGHRSSRRSRRTSTTAGSIEATARALFVHPNTVRYRLRQVAELTGSRPTDARGRVHLRRSRWCSAASPAAPATDATIFVGTLQRIARRVSCAPDGETGAPARQSGARARHRRSRPGSPDPRLPHALARGPHVRRPASTWLSTVAGLDLAHYGTEADAETIRDTQIAQPLLVATGLVAALELFPHPADAFGQIGAVAGHSVGEIAAAAGARAITAEQAMVLVRERGKAMAEAAARPPRPA